MSVAAMAQDASSKGTLTAAPAAASASSSDRSVAEVSAPKQAADYEDWTTPSLETSHLVAVPALLGEKNDFGDFTRELLQVQWREGDPIDLYVIKPKGAVKPPVILYLYGHPDDTDRFKDDEFCKVLVKGGFAAVGFVPALSGHRFHDRPMKQWYVSELQETLSTSAHDVQMVVNYLATRDDLDLTRLGMLGEGSGGTIGILSAAADSRIKVLDTLRPWGDWPDWMAKSTRIPEEERVNFVKPEFLKKAAGLDPVEWLPRIHNAAVRVQIVEPDTITPKAAQDAIAAAAPGTMTLVRYKDGKQIYDALALGKTFDWVKAQVGGEKK
jgi:hypothetical protein